MSSLVHETSINHERDITTDNTNGNGGSNDSSTENPTAVAGAPNLSISSGLSDESNVEIKPSINGTHEKEQATQSQSRDATPTKDSIISSDGSLPTPTSLKDSTDIYESHIDSSIKPSPSDNQDKLPASESVKDNTTNANNSTKSSEKSIDFNGIKIDVRAPPLATTEPKLVTISSRNTSTSPSSRGESPINSSSSTNTNIDEGLQSTGKEQLKHNLPSSHSQPSAGLMPLAKQDNSNAVSTAPSRTFPRWSELHSAFDMETEREPQSEVMYRSLIALLNSRGISPTKEVGEFITDLAEDYLSSLVSELKKAAMMQRRTTPGINDVMVLLHLSGLHLSMLGEEMEEQSKNPTGLHDLWQFMDFDGLMEKENTVDQAFLESKETSIKKLLPSTYDLGSHIPPWMPAFPPEHTFRTTPYHPNRVTNPRVLREMIVKEGQLAEQALRRLTGVVKVDDNAFMDYQDDDGDKDRDYDLEEKKDGLKSDYELDILKASQISTTDQTNRAIEIKEEAMNDDIIPLDKDQAPKPIISLKLSLSTTSADGSSTTETSSAQTTSTLASAKTDPFGIKTPLKKPFNMVEYIQKRAIIGAKRRQKEQGIVSKEEHRQRALEWHRALVESNFNTHLYNSQHVNTLGEIEPEEEDKTPDGFGPAPSVVENEYNAALLWISKSKKSADGQQKTDIADTGIVNCERNKYIY